MDAWKSVFSWPEALSADRAGQMASPFQSHQMFQNTLARMTEPVFSAIARMLTHWQTQLVQSGDGGSALDLNSLGFKGEFQNSHKEILDVWNRLYDQEIRKFFTIPQLGLAREHQEKINRFLDQWNMLQSAMAEFVHFLSIPLEKTQADFQEKLTELAKSNALPTDISGFYRIWLKILEGHYMTLFQSPDYGASLGKTLSAAAAWSRAKKAIVDDLLRQMSLPSSGHLDGVYQDLHELKKRVKSLEKAAASRNSR
jgi:class III poly(R)-hydroxyalkanoic acid synthase PhaE subunit